MKFLPRPPKSCLTMMIAKNDPTTGIHRGVDAGRFIASSIPVTTADKSPMVADFFKKYRYSHSKAIQEHTEIAVNVKDRQPKK